VVDGLVDTQKGTNNSANDPLEALIAIKDLKEKTLILLRDFHLFLQDPNPILIRQLKDVLQMAKTKSISYAMLTLNLSFTVKSCRSPKSTTPLTRGQRG
jgi:hypothetical protein